MTRPSSQGTVGFSKGSVESSDLMKAMSCPTSLSESFTGLSFGA
jgi:hypothetical protein